MTPHLPVFSARTALAAALAALALVAVPGCSRPEEPPDAAGPASAYIDLVLDVTAESSAQQAIEYEEFVAACMAEAGFEYVPYTGNTYLSEWDDAERASREWAEQYGYGFAPPREDDSVRLGPAEDPNLAIQAAMSQTQQSEYFIALMGTWHRDHPQGGAPEDYGEEMDWTQFGCTGRAQLEVYRAGPEADVTYTALREEVDRIETEVVPTHPKVVAADAEWSECMSDAGYPGYARQLDAEDQWFEHYMDTGGGGGEVGPDGLVLGQAEQAEEERALATADWDCRDATGYDDVVARVRNAAQQEYVDAHLDELDAWVERWAEQ